MILSVGWIPASYWLNSVFRKTHILFLRSNTLYYFPLESDVIQELSSLIFSPGTKLEHSNRMKRVKRAKRMPLKRNLKSKITCIECGDDFPRNSELMKHTRLMHPKKNQFRCGECGRSYKYKSSLYKHRKQSNHSIGAAKRNKSANVSDVENSLDFKISELFSMIMTGDNVKSERGSVKRSNGVNKRLPYRCDECGKKFSLRRSLTRHQRKVHTSADLIKCEYCAEEFKHRITLYGHRQLCSLRNSSYVDHENYSLNFL